MTTKESEKIFVIGAGRSGTTFFYDLLTMHPDFSFFTNYDDILAGTPFFGFTRRLFENSTWNKLGRRCNWKKINDFGSLWPRKTEAYRFWRRYAGHDFTHGYLWHKRPNDQVAIKIRNKVEMLRRLQRRPGFSAKLTGPGRIEYLQAIFPNAKFIHVVRDARAQVCSVLNVGFWQAGGGGTKLWWTKDLPDSMASYLREAEASGDSLALAAAQWRSVVISIRDEAARLLTADDYREVSYEDFVLNPVATIIELWRWLGLQPATGTLAKLGSIKARTDLNNRWKSEFSLQQQAILAHWLDRQL